MKTIMKLLSLLLCLELIVAPVAGSFVMTTNVWAQAKDCPAGQEYNSDLNRCTTKASVTSIKENVDTCRNIADEAVRKKCYTDNANNMANKEKEYNRKTGHLNENGGATAGNIASSAATIALPLLFLIKALKDSKKSNVSCKPASLMLMYGGGAALLLGEVVSFIQHKSNLKKMEEERKKMTVTENADNTDDNKMIASEAQSQAFELLAQNEDSIAKVAKTKMITYGVATGLFAVGAVMATIESFQYKKALLTPTQADSISTIQRVTCGQDPNSKNTATDKPITAENSSTKDDSTAGDDSKADKGKDGKDEGTSIESIIQIASVATPIATEVLKKKPEGSSAAPATNDKLPGTEETVDPQSCGEGQQWSASEGKCVQISAINLDDILNYKYKIKAAHNIKHAKSYPDMIQMMAEIESMGHENFSRTSYYEEAELNESLKEVSFVSEAAELISNLFISKAYAQREPVKASEIKSAPIVKPELKGELITAKAQAVNNAGKKVQGIMNKAVYLPAGRLITNGLLGTWMGIMTGHMAKQQKVSKERAELLRKMKSEFETQGGIATCSSADRTDPGKPVCYCFTSDNKPNPSTMNNKVCSMKLVGLNNNNNPQNNSPKVCVDQNMAADVNCSCRKNNSCLKVPTSFKMSGFTPGTFKMLSSATMGANDLLNGNTDVGSMDAGAIGANAARLKEIADKEIAKDPKAKKNSNNLAQSLMASTPGLAPAGAGFSSGSSPMPSSPAAAAAALDKEIQGAEEVKVNTAGAGGPTAAPTAVEEQPEFGLTDDQLAAQETEIAEVMKQDIDMGNSDINNGSKTNIFDVLSNRYQRSGMRRLFDEEGKTKADDAAKTDISQ